MMLAGRDPLIFSELKKMSIIDYLILLDNFAKEQEAADEQVSKFKEKAQS